MCGASRPETCKFLFDEMTCPSRRMLQISRLGKMPGTVQSLDTLTRAQVYTTVSSCGETFLAGDEWISGEDKSQRLVGCLGDADAGSDADIFSAEAIFAEP
jgi:hypothetical protein